MSKSKKVTIGFKYYFDILMGLGRGPYDRILHIKVGDKTAWTGNITSNTTIRIDKPNLFGGEKKEGGIDGYLEVMMGAPDQGLNARLAAMLGGLVSAYRGVVTLYYRGLVTAMTPYPKPWSVRHARYQAGWDGPVWYPERALITITDPESGGTIYAMNPAHILYQLETDRDFGRGRPRTMIDDAVWRAAADTLYSEGFGLCLRWVRTGSMAEFVGNVLSHIGANLYTSRNTGLRKLTLIRDDYDPETLPHFTPDSGLLDIEEDENSSIGQAINEMIVTWRNPIDNTERKARERNPAAVRAAGGRIISDDAVYIGAPTHAIAARLARRDLRLKGIVKRWKLVLDRRARNIEPGAAFKFSDPSRGLINIVVRAGRIVDDGMIEITALLDVFGLPSSTFTQQVPSGWAPPDSTPAPITVRRLVEATWRDLVLNIDAANLSLVGDSSGFVRTLAIKPTSMSLSYDLQSRVGSAEWETKEVGDFCPSATLSAAVSRTATLFSLGDDVDLDLVLPGTAALVDNEWLKVVSVDLETMTMVVGRGCIDSVPAEHAVGARIWFVDDFGGDDPTEYTATTNVQVRLLTTTTTDQLDPVDAGADTITIGARQARPYPPGNFAVNGGAWPSTVVGDIVAAWAHRDRLLQADQLITTTDGSIGPEPGTTYTVQLLNNSTNAVLVSHTGIAGVTDTILESELAGLDGVVVRLEVFSVRGGVESLYRQAAAFTWSATPP